MLPASNALEMMSAIEPLEIRQEEMPPLIRPQFR
jgi:hypothetical protein